ncbi:hypothetical protein C0J45_22431 [Silurus meridionalis]|nr:hypothetical protein C0J45_22431 [Silurus meridionalis]
MKTEDLRVTYKSGGRCTQIDNILCRRCNLKEIGDCKVLAGDSVARQHWMVVCRMVLKVKKKKRRVKTERRIRWWKLKEEHCSVRFREEVRQELGGGEEVLDDWATTAEVIRKTARKVLFVTSGKRKEDKETWWWNEEMQEIIRRKRLVKQDWDRQSDEKSRQEYKEMQQMRMIALKNYDPGCVLPVTENAACHVTKKLESLRPEDYPKCSLGIDLNQTSSGTTQPSYTLYI